MILADILKASANRIKDTTEAEDYVGGVENLKALRRVGWVKPWKDLRSSVQYDTRDLDTAIDRVKVEGWPNP